MIVAEKDIENFDYLTIEVYEDLANEIKLSYKIFGWEIISEKKTNFVSERVVFSMRRPHKIKNKDDLQYYQVDLEERINDVGKLEQNKYSRSVVIGLTFALFWTLVCTCSVLMLFRAELLWAKVVLGAFILCLLVEFGYAIFKLFKLKKFEDKIFEKKLKVLKDEIYACCAIAKNLLEENDGGED